MMGSMNESPLNPLHARLGARMAQKDGWNMPHSFRNLMEEHLAARSACAIFDISHISKFLVRGNGALAWLETQLSQKLADCQDGASTHTLLLDGHGKIIDKMALLRESAGSFYLLGHAGVEAQVSAWLHTHKTNASLEIRNETNRWCAMALMGPHCEQVLYRVLRGCVELPGMQRFMRFFYQNHELILGRLGLHEEAESERMYEFFCPAVAGISWFESFMGAGAQPCGASTRESLRLERGCVAVGSEITRQSTPAEVGLASLCSVKNLTATEGDAPKPREVVVHLRCVEPGRIVPEPGSAVRDSIGSTVGHITSAAFSPTHDSVVAMALIATPLAQNGMHLVVMVQGRPVPAVVMKE